MAEVLFEIPEWLDYADYDNYPSESKPTTNADFINYSRNQNKLVGALTSAFLWQPNTNFITGKIIITPNMPEGMEAVALTGGFTGTVEPAWKSDIAEYQDSGVKWQLRYQHWSKEGYAMADYPLRNKAYSLNSMVACPYHAGFILKCTQAGTTSTGSLDTTSATLGKVYTDGGVKWEVVALPIELGGTGAITAKEACSNIGALPANGGVMDGSIRFTSDGNNIRRVGASGFIQVCGGDNNNYGASLLLFGEEYYPQYYGGGFELSTSKDGNNVSIALKGMQDGTLKWNGLEVERVNSQGSSESNNDIDDVQQHYIRYENGLQVIWGRCWAYNSKLTTINYIVPFIEAPIVVPSYYNQTAGIAYDSGVAPSETSFTITTNANPRGGFGYMAIGKWK